MHLAMGRKRLPVNRKKPQTELGGRGGAAICLSQLWGVAREEMSAEQ